MKSRLSAFLIVFLFVLMLLCPEPVFRGAAGGLVLWYQNVLPSLLPFMIFSNLMIHTNAINYISRYTGPLLQKIFSVSPCGSFAILTGFLCGYPMGAKTTADLVRSGRISIAEGNYLLSFCNNTSPMFVISFIVWQNLQRESALAPTIAILFLSPALCSFLFRMYYARKEKFAGQKGQAEIQGGAKKLFSFQLLDDCMMNSFEAIIKVGGYIMLFSIAIQLASLFFPRHAFFTVLLSSLEITNGISAVSRLSFPFGVRWACILSLASFGGFCAAAQTNCMIQNSGLKLLPYITEKLVTMLVTSLIAYVYLQCGFPL